MKTSQVKGVVTVTPAAGLATIDASQGNIFNVTLAANTTFSILNIKPGEDIKLIITQDPAVARTIAFNGAVTGAYTVSGTATAVSVNAALGSVTTITLTGLTQSNTTGSNPTGTARATANQQ